MFICCQSLIGMQRHRKTKYICSWYLVAGVKASGGGPVKGKSRQYKRRRVLVSKNAPSSAVKKRKDDTRSLDDDDVLTL